MEDEKRREIRIPIEELPECLRIIYFSIGSFGEYSATTIDASNSGMSFVSTGVFEKDLPVGKEMTIKIMPYNYKLKSTLAYAKVIFVKEIGKDILRFGVSFNEGPALEKYQEILKSGECPT